MPDGLRTTEPSLNVWKLGTSDERHVLFNTRDMPYLIFLGSQHSFALARTVRCIGTVGREPPAVPILFGNYSASPCIQDCCRRLPPPYSSAPALDAQLGCHS